MRWSKEDTQVSRQGLFLRLVHFPRNLALCVKQY